MGTSTIPIIPETKASLLYANEYDYDTNIKAEELALLKILFYSHFPLLFTISVVCRDTPLWSNSVLHTNRC